MNNRGGERVLCAFQCPSVRQFQGSSARFQPLPPASTCCDRLMPLIRPSRRTSPLCRCQLCALHTFPPKSERDSRRAGEPSESGDRRSAIGLSLTAKARAERSCVHGRREAALQSRLESQNAEPSAGAQFPKSQCSYGQTDMRTL
ncbi:uncharacterized protein LOC127012517 [Drosophila biarmipes]|uniref:uncharacterized protein LOC127012517 n=1 Tax=Drosophila biarmipes TaxID=125945 RepID=UPI0021CD05AF|nr:uncharacterized protein LOC127012517 [Drosophila biarmipes]